MDFILDEGMFVIDGVLPGVDRPVAYFGVVEKGWATLDMTANGGQGTIKNILKTLKEKFWKLLFCMKVTLTVT